MTESDGAVKLAVDAIDVPPVETSYQRYSWVPVAPEAVRVMVPVPQRLTGFDKGGSGGKQVTTKLVLLVPVPASVVTEMGPVVDPTGTVTVKLVADAAEGVVAVTPLKLTVLLAATGSKLVPAITTVVPMGPEVGVKDVMLGTDTTAQKVPEGESPTIVHPLVVVKLVLAAAALVPYCRPVAPNVRPFGVEGFALQPIRVAE